MLVSTLDLLTQAASSSLYAFCFCNLIIVMILVGSKPGSYFEQEKEIPHAVITYTVTNRKQVDDHDAKSEQKTMTSSSIVQFREEVSDAKKELASDEQAGGIDHRNDGNTECDCDNGDELRRRAEAFIEKVNREWRAEMLRTSQLV